MSGLESFAASKVPKEKPLTPGQLLLQDQGIQPRTYLLVGLGAVVAVILGYRFWKSRS